jgi:endonuclease YncB( thermonuclease family)
VRIKFFIALLFLSHSVFSQLVGKVVSVADGDTFTMLVNNEQIRIRLHGIDCPEKSQDFGNVAKQFLSGYVFGKVVTVQNMDTDRYGRTVGMVTIDGINVNEKLLEAGLAWHYIKYDKNPKWTEVEEVARSQKKGLWSQSNPIPPWEYRKMKR